jgi:hypothetical protein
MKAIKNNKNNKILIYNKINITNLQIVHQYELNVKILIIKV